MKYDFKITVFITVDTEHKSYDGPTDPDLILADLRKETDGMPTDNQDGVLATSVQVEHVE